MLKLKEWFFSVNLSWVSSFNFDSDVDLIIISKGSTSDLKKTFKERDVIDEEANQSPQNHILMAYRAQLLQILMDPDVKNALMRGETSNPG
mgnify:FL=1